ncbi:hypothetical protein ACF0H5_020609 [Mactra antiquata]
MFVLRVFLGSIYTRWGRTTCPGNGTDLAYSGYMAGTYHTGTTKGSGANYLCLAGDPTWDFYSESINNDAKLTGVEYEFWPHRSILADFFGSDIKDAEAPCSVCRTSRNTNMMIPGRKDCYPGWTKEYSGYLVGPYSGYDDGSEYVCLDRRPETVVNSGNDDNDNMLYFIDSRCDASLECLALFVQFNTVMEYSKFSSK